MSEGEESGPAALELFGLHKTFRAGLRRRHVEAVRGVDLRVEQGEIFGYLGPNGAGKTTTIRMAVGLIRPTGGSVRIFGRPIAGREVLNRVGYLPEGPYFYDYLSAEEILDYYARLFGLRRKERGKRVGELLELVGLGAAGRRRLRGFSKGMLQRVGIAQALINDPDLVILDEPLSGLDPMGRREVRDIIVDLRRRGKTVFFSSHILHDIEMICDRVAILLHGRLDKLGRLADFQTGRAGRVEVVARGVDDALYRRLEEQGVAMSRVGDSATAQVDEGEVEAVLRALLDGGTHVVRVDAHRESLEDLFVREAGAADGS